MKIMKLTPLVLTFLIFWTLPTKANVSEVFSPDNKTQKVLDIEAALARAQAKLGIIPDWAAQELSDKAQVKYVSQQALETEYAIVRHRMVALLNVWKSSINNGADEYMHFGATTVDIYDTTLVLQLLESTELLINRLVSIENTLISMALKHKSTVMIGRTLGQHALPITFGKKVSTWLGENHRNIERLRAVQARLKRSAILKGAVGSYLGFGEKGIELEALFAQELGLNKPYLDDWHGSRDVFADYAMTLAMISKSFGRIGNELFMLQMTDIGETEEVRAKTAVGSSTMPHKKNPSKSEALVFYARTIPRLSEVILDDMINVFERDNTSRTNSKLAEISIEAEKMLKAANGLLKNLKVKPEVMLANLDKTQGLVMAQRVTFYLADKIGKTTANDKLHELAVAALSQGVSLRSLIAKDKEINRFFDEKTLDELFDVTTYIGLAEAQVDAIVNQIKKSR